MQTLSFETLAVARNALKREVEDLEKLAHDHVALGCPSSADQFMRNANRLERAMSELCRAMGGAR